MKRDCNRADLRENVSAASLTTLGTGGPCRFLVGIRRREELGTWYTWARELGLPILIVGGGSNLLISDEGFPGLVLVNRIRGRFQQGDEITVAAGEPLSDLIRWTNRLGLGGWERMFGIPGTVAGAVVGNAGAYGQDIGSRVEAVEVWTGSEIVRLGRHELDFGYRYSSLKQRPEWFVVSVRLKLVPGRQDLYSVSDRIYEERLKKYPAGLKSCGSFFKNVPIEQLSPTACQCLPPEFIQFDKVPAGKLLAEVGACGQRQGGAMIAVHHGNLFFNAGNASSRDFLTLAEKWSARVWERFRIRLEPEVVVAPADQRATQAN